MDLTKIPKQELFYLGSFILFVTGGLLWLWMILQGRTVPADLNEFVWTMGGALGVERIIALGKRATTWKPTEVAEAAKIAANTPPTAITSGPPVAAINTASSSQPGAGQADAGVVVRS